MPSPEGVGLVLVSHSRALADAAIALAQEMGGSVRVRAAAGLDDAGSDQPTFGTDAVAIAGAIQAVDGPAGVVVLMDLGSAVLSAEMALELLDDEATRERVTLCPAPVVEGLLVAAVAAAGGASRDEVAAQARDALAGKLEQLGAGEAPAAVPVEGDVRGRFTVENPHGLHARPAARLVAAVRALDATVTLRNRDTGSGPVPAGSLSRVATLGARRGHVIEVAAEGPDAERAVADLVALAGRRFDEVREAPPAARSSQAGAPGIAIGPARHLVTGSSGPGVEEPAEPGARWQRLTEAIALVRREIDALRADTARTDEAAAEIFGAHLALLDDEELLGRVRGRVEDGDGAVDAWSATLGEVAGQWAAVDDEYLRERATDVRDVAQQVVRALTGGRVEASGAGVLLTPDLTAAQAAALDEAVVGVVLAGGSASSHVAILARARGLPLVVGAGALQAAEGTTVALDGAAGEVVVNPAPDVEADFRRRAETLARRRAQQLASAHGPAVTRDGVTVHVVANVGSVADAAAAYAAGAEGAGLVRTEFLFRGRDTAPDTDEQVATYTAVSEALGGQPIVLRTLDVGGDKPLPYLPMPTEANPFLGMRGIRLGLAHPDLQREQLDAVCRVARTAPVAVMFPMVATLDELLAARALLVEAAGPDGVPARVGMMVEVPAAALKIASFVEHLDFVSIGTNDLTQYVMAAERGNPAVAELSDALDPGVLRLIEQVCSAAAGRIDVAVCGEAAADEASIALLVGLGVRELSVAPPAVPGVKAAVRGLDAQRCRALAERAMALASAAEVRASVSGARTVVP